MDVPSWVKPGVWGLIIGALVWWGVLAWGFGWVSGGTAEQMAAAATESAVVAAASPYCVARFERQANAAAAWKALKNSADNYNQEGYMEKGGWVALPGQKFSAQIADAIADACSNKLLALNAIGGVKVSSLK